MARALCWTALWNSARDGETPATRYVDAVTAFGPSETGIGVLLNILDNASTAVERYMPAAATRSRARRRSWPRPPPSWTRPFRAPTSSSPGRGRSPPSAGTTPPSSRGSGASWTARQWSRAWRWTPNCAGTSGTRWRPTARPPWRSWTPNWRGTPRPRAGPATPRPSPPGRTRKSRQRAWKEAVHGTELSNQLLSATIAGFTTAPAALLEPYVEPYFECLRDVWDGPEHRDRQPDRPGSVPVGAGPAGGWHPAGGARRWCSAPMPGWPPTPTRPAPCAGSSWSSAATCCGRSPRRPRHTHRLLRNGRFDAQNGRYGAAEDNRWV